MCTQARRKGATVHSRNEVTKLSTLINDGSHVIEMFKSSFEDYLKIYTKHNEFIRFSLNVKDESSVKFSCISARASEYIKFIDAINTEVIKNDIAIVIANDYRYDSDETTIFVVCND